MKGLPLLVILPLTWTGKLPEEDNLVVVDHGHQAGGALTVARGAGVYPSSPEKIIVNILNYYYETLNQRIQC